MIHISRTLSPHMPHPVQQKFTLQGEIGDNFILDDTMFE